MHTHPGDPRRAAHRRRLARSLAAILGVDPVWVTAGDDRHRGYGGWPGYLLAVTEPEGTTWRFIATPAAADVFLLLGDCPGCGATEVPIVAVAELADLGRHLDPRADSSVPAEFGWDPRHRPGCRNHHPGS